MDFNPINAVGSAFDVANQWAGNLFNANQSAVNREFQRQMSNTAHQREVADLRAAGLNPILSATGGQGASTPGGSAASAGHAPSIAQSVTSAQKVKVDQGSLDIARKQLELQERATNAEVELKLAQKANVEANTLTAALGPERSRAEIAVALKSLGVSDAQIAQYSASAGKLRADTALSTAELPLAKIKQDFYTALGPFVGQVLGIIRELGSMVKGMNGQQFIQTVGQKLSGDGRKAWNSAVNTWKSNTGDKMGSEQLNIVKDWFYGGEPSGASGTFGASSSGKW